MERLSMLFRPPWKGLAGSREGRGGRRRGAQPGRRACSLRCLAKCCALVAREVVLFLFKQQVSEVLPELCYGAACQDWQSLQDFCVLLPVCPSVRLWPSVHMEQDGHLPAPTPLPQRGR